MKETPVILDREISLILSFPFNKSVALGTTLDEQLMKERWLEIGLFAKTDGQNVRRAVIDNTLIVLKAIPYDRYIPGWDICNITGLDEDAVRGAVKVLKHKKLITDRKCTYWTNYRRKV